ncbi:ASCH domain-containing protein [Actinoplanes sp. NPDC049316]|uniref:ASCH domain-containing protein n=1 Tax=Actinoplanes sp. NPDC049316 TaxID=3154727 RepID=UPI003432FA76
MTTPSSDLPAAEIALVEAARSALRDSGDGDIHTVAAAILDENGRIHVGLNLYHFTGGPCAELVALAVARAGGAREPRLIVAVGDDGRGILAPCGRDRQVLADYYPDIHVIVPTSEGTQVVPISDLLPHTYQWANQKVQRLRFRATHLPAVRDGSKRVTMRFGDPVQVGPALLVFDSDNEVCLRGRITSTVAKRVDSINDDEAREDGFTSAADVLPGLRDYYPALQASDEIMIVRFEMNG